MMQGRKGRCRRQREFVQSRKLTQLHKPALARAHKAWRGQRAKCPSAGEGLCAERRFAQLEESIASRTHTMKCTTGWFESCRP